MGVKLLSERGFSAAYKNRLKNKRLENMQKKKTQRRRGTSMGKSLAQYSRAEAMRRIRAIMLGKGLAQRGRTKWSRIFSGRKKSLAQSKETREESRCRRGWCQAPGANGFRTTGLRGLAQSKETREESRCRRGWCQAPGANGFRTTGLRGLAQSKGY